MKNSIKKIKQILKNTYNDFKYNKYIKITNKNVDGITADIIRLTHSLEKGLTIKNVRLGFGHEKQSQIMNMISILEKNNLDHYNIEAIKMAVNVFNSYLEYHKKNNYSDKYFNELEEFVRNHKKYLTSNYAGVKIIKREELKFNINEIEHFFQTRHSIRDFSGESVDKNLVKKAIKLAQTSPSACNRQAYRCYIVDKKKINDFGNWLSGIGGFADNIDKIIFVTGKTSAYRYGENYQYIVSASIFAAYLSLTLHLYGMGACIIQRPVVWTKKWDSIRKKNNISNDEQIVLCIGIGMLKGNTVVPISHRFDTDEICNFIE